VKKPKLGHVVSDDCSVRGSSEPDVLGSELSSPPVVGFFTFFEQVIIPPVVVAFYSFGQVFEKKKMLLLM
jgi:hypothetical protein